MSDLEITFLGQMGLRMQHEEIVLYIDPFLSDHPRRQVPAPIAIEDVCDADFILGTHDHKDHIDRDAWPRFARHSPKAMFIVPELVRRRGLAGELGISSDRFLGLNHDQCVSMGDMRVTGVASAHEFLDQDSESGLYPYLGYIIEVGGFVIYHAGDTCRYEGLETTLKAWNFDVMMLPINGRDAVRYSTGYLGNMTYQEAVDLAGEVKPGLVIPGHYDLFAHNGADPGNFTEYLSSKYPDVTPLICEPSLTYRIKK